MERRTLTAWVVMEKPATRASPEEGGNRVVSILIVVVLPAPLEPSNPKTSPAFTDKVSASTAVNAPKRRVRLLISRTISLISAFQHEVRLPLPRDGHNNPPHSTLARRREKTSGSWGP